MNTLSMPSRASGTGLPTRGGAYVFPSGSAAGARRPLEWLPVPAVPVKPAERPQGRGTSSRLYRLSTRREPFMPRLLFGLLSGAAVLGIGYGFSCLVDLVQHWAMFDAGISRLLQ